MNKQCPKRLSQIFAGARILVLGPIYLGCLALVLLPAVARADIHANLQVRYPFDEGSGITANDSSTNTGRNGTLTNGAAFISGGRVGGAVDLDASNDFVDCPAITQTDSASALTVAFWLNTDSRADDEYMVSKFLDASNLFKITFGAAATVGNDDLVVTIGTSSTPGTVSSNSNVLSNAQWIHVAVVFEGTQSGNKNRCRIYINGLLLDNTRVTDTGTIPAALLNSSTDHWYIGWQDNTPADLSLDGKVDEFHLYTRALSASDIQELYFQSDGSILFNGAAANPNSKLENTSASLLGTSDEVTICAWLFPTGQGEAVSTMGGVAVALDEAGSNFDLFHPTNSENLTFRARYSSADSLSTFAVPHNVWTHVAIAHKYTSGSTPTIRVNYQTVTPTQTGPLGSPVAVNPGFCIGNVTGQTNTWAGRIAHVQVFNRLLSAGEMDAVLREPGSIKYGLRLWLPMSSAAQADTTDRSGNDFHPTGTALETANGPPYDPRFSFGVADLISAQILIRSNGNEPALGVRGVGTRTKLTRHSILANGARMITTEAYGIANSQVVEPTVRDMYMFGNFGIPDHPYGNENELDIEDPVCHAIAIDGDAATVRGCKIYDFRGDAITVKNTTYEFSRMIRMPRVINNKISHCWNGILAAAVDTQIDGNRVANVRDTGILVTGGSVQCSNNHVFGATTGIRFEFGPSRSIGDRFSDSSTGFYVHTNASGSDIIGGTTEHCGFKNMDIRGQRVHIADTRIKVANSSTQKPGIIGCDLHYEGSRAVMADCEVEFPDYTFGGHTGITGSTGVYMQHHNARVENLQLTGSAQAGEIGVRVGDGGPADGLNGIYIYVDSSGNGAGFDDSGDR
jgi:hypothetical protein